MRDITPMRFAKFFQQGRDLGVLNMAAKKIFHACACKREKSLEDKINRRRRAFNIKKYCADLGRVEWWRQLQLIVPRGAI